jgi:DNA-binding GntR family transcriptional regulator
VTEHRQADGPRALVDELTATLSSRILSGRYSDNKWLRQEMLAEEFDVSRTPIREALRKLEASGLLILVPRRGAMVKWPSSRDVREGYQVRAELEGLAAELAARWIVDKYLVQLRSAQELFRQAAAPFIASKPRRGSPASARERWEEGNDLFHSVIHEAAGNSRLRDAIRDLHVRLPRNLTWAALQEDSRLINENVEAHDAILIEIEKHDPVQARHEMKKHILRAGELVAEWFDRQELRS